MRYKLTMEYDGSAFAGWQKQQNAVTVQGTLIEAATRVLETKGGKFGDLQGAGRTDAGVHAFAQVAHLDCETGMNTANLLKRINQELPPALNILSLEQAPTGFHARHSATARQYLYRIGKRRNVFERQYQHWVPAPLDPGPMLTALESLPGLHDFASFSSQPEKEKSTLVELQSYELIDEEDVLMLRLKASHFLWNMVRNLTGVLIEIGKGKLKPAVVQQALESYDQKLTLYRAPACGLFLEWVDY